MTHVVLQHQTKLLNFLLTSITPNSLLDQIQTILTMIGEEKYINSRKINYLFIQLNSFAYFEMIECSICAPDNSFVDTDSDSNTVTITVCETFCQNFYSACKDVSLINVLKKNKFVNDKY